MRQLLHRTFTRRPYAPIFATILLALLISVGGAISQVLPQAQVFTPKGESVSAQAQAGLLNSLLLFIPAFLGGFVIVFLIKRRKHNMLLYMYRSLFFLLSFLIFYFLGDIPLRLISPYIIPEFPSFIFRGSILPTLNWEAPVGVGIVISAIVVSQLFNPRADRIKKNSALIFLSGMMGGFMAILFPTWTVLITLLLLSAYDFYAVFYGPIKDLVGLSVKETPVAISPRDIVSSLLYEGEGWELGMGDLVFYSLLTSHAVYYGFTHPHMGSLTWALYLLPVLLSLLIGFYITEKLLKRVELLPALPIPMGMGVTTFVLLILLFP